MSPICWLIHQPTNKLKQKYNLFGGSKKQTTQTTYNTEENYSQQKINVKEHNSNGKKIIAYTAHIYKHALLIISSVKLMLTISSPVGLGHLSRSGWFVWCSSVGRISEWEGFRSRRRWLVLRKSCELIVLRVVREVIIFNSSDFTAVKNNGFDANGGGVPPNPHSGYATGLMRRWELPDVKFFAWIFLTYNIA